MTDQSGRPIAGASLQVANLQAQEACPDLFVGSPSTWVPTLWSPVAVPSSYTVEQTHRADSDGAFEIELGARVSAPPILLVRSPGLAPTLLIGRLGIGQAIVLTSGHTIHVQVMSAGGEPLPGAVCDLVPLYICTPILAAFRDGLIRRGTSGERGWLELSNVSGGAYALRVAAEGHAIGTALPLMVNGSNEEVRIWLSRGRSFQGRIEPPPGAPPDHGSVIAVWRAGHGMLEWDRAEFGPESMEYSLAGLPMDRGVKIVAASEAGLVSRVIFLDDDALDQRISSQPLVLAPSRTWRRRIKGNASKDTVYADAIAPEDFSFLQIGGVRELTTEADGALLVSDIPAPVETLRIVRPGKGHADVRLDQGEAMDTSEMVLDSTQAFQGVVVASDLSPLSGARVWAGSPGAPACSTRTTREGRFACIWQVDSNEPPLLFVTTEGGALPLALRPGRSPNSFVASPGTPLGFTVVQRRTGAPVEDMAIRAERAPLASEKGWEKTGGELTSVFAKAPGGKLSLHLAPSAPLRLSVGPASADPTSRLGLDKEATLAGTRITVTVPGPLDVRGIVVSGDSNRPIPGAEVALRSEAAAPGQLQVERVIHASSDGAWTYGDIKPGKYRLAASAPGYVPERTLIRVSADGAAGFHRVSLDPAGMVDGLVIGAPPDGRVLPFLVGRFPGADDRPRRTEADASGRFVFDSISPGVYIVDLKVEMDAGRTRLGRTSVPFEIRPGEVRHVEFDLKSRVALFGRSFLGETATAESRLTFRSTGRVEGGATSTFTDREGRYEVHLPGPGTYVVHVTDDAAGLEGQSKLQLEITGEGRQRRDLHFSASSMQGRVLNPQGGPIAGARVSLERLAHESGGVPTASRTRKRFVLDVRTDDDGRFELPGLPAGKYRVQVSGEGFSSRLLGPMMLEEDESARLGDIVLGSGKALEILALGPAGERLQGAIIQAYAAGDFNGAPLHIPIGASTEQGKALIEDLEPGEYTLLGSHSDLAPSILEGVLIPDDLPPEAVILKFTRGGILEIQVIGKDGIPRAGVAVRVIDEHGWDMTYTYKSPTDSSAPSFTDAKGWLVLDAVRPGMYRLGVFEEGRFNPQTVQVREAQTTRSFLVSD